MNNSFKKAFNTDGYITSKNFLSLQDKRRIANVIYEEFHDEIGIKNKKDFTVEGQEFHDKLIKLRKNNPKIFGKIYDRMNLNANLRSIFYTKKMLKNFSTILNTKVENIYLNGFMCRFDAPNEDRNSLEWHQDTPYYLETYPKMNAGVCWMAVTKNSSKNGTLIYIPRSHHKIIKPNSFKKDKFHSEQKKIAISKNELLNKKNLNVSFGDVSFIHMNLKHRSGENSSNKFRITLGCRFHDMKSNFNIGYEQYVFHDKKMLNLF